MKGWKAFIFEDYEFNVSTGVLTLSYSYDSELFFTETYTFPTQGIDSSRLPAIESAAFALFIMSGVSYYKAYLTPTVDIKKGALDQAQADFFYTTYLYGLGQLLFENKLSPSRVAHFPVSENGASSKAVSVSVDGLLVAFGGGKDSLLAMNILESQGASLDIFSVRPTPALTTIASSTGHKFWTVSRVLDPKIAELNANGAFNGHLPITGIVSAASLVLALCIGKKEVVFSNERSTREPSLIHEGLPVNHQYSKSFAFEQAFQQYIKHYISGDVLYYSLLRPLTDLQIAKVFANRLFANYGQSFTSCNTNFKLDGIDSRPYWCGHCTKCAATFLLFSPFVEKEKLTELFNGKDLLADASLDSVYRQLLGLEGYKPLDCVGEIEENRLALHMAIATNAYPEAARFNCPKSTFDNTVFGEHAMPEERVQNVKNFIA